MIPNYRYLILLLAPMLLAAQEKTDLQQILERLDRLEQENKDLAAEVRSLRAEIAGSRITSKPEVSAAAAPQTGAAPATPPLDERVTVAEHRIDEQAQEKVQASQRLPITLTGMVLFNGYLNGKANGGDQNPWIASPTDSTQVGGASLSQSVVGLQFQGPKVIGGGHVNASAYFDLYGGSASSLNHLVRLRVATISIDWKNTSIAVGQDKPIIAPREPNSLAQVEVSPLTSAGNLWLWQPQVRIEQRFSFGEQAGLRAQLGVYQTSEPSASDRGAYGTDISTAARPGLEGRFEFWRQFGEGKRIEIAPGFHVSTTHVAGVSIPSRLFSLDWLIQPLPKIQFTGAFFHGENDAGVGGLRQGFTIFDSGRVAGIGATGAWSQLSLLATGRLSFNLYGGEENDRAGDLRAGDIHRNLIYAGNAIYRIGPNVLLGLEASQVRTDYLWAPGRLNNHYDVALGYLF
ncbi:MAG TPA: hypothetical protein VN519_14600 [Bryobacteraceae bacterium]|nr:hypothetical protein [Bryobacteraceae bacterium]